jgi:hypothetical protein
MPSVVSSESSTQGTEILGSVIHEVHNGLVRSRIVLLLLLLASLVGPAVSAATPVERAHRLAELRVERLDLLSLTADARIVLHELATELDLAQYELDAALAAQTVALEELEAVQDDLRRARAEFEGNVQDLYMRGGSAEATAVVIFDNPAEATVAIEYLNAVTGAELAVLDEIAAHLDVMDGLKGIAFDAVDDAEDGFEAKQRRFAAAAAVVAQLESELAELEGRITALETEWSRYRLQLSEELIGTTDAAGTLADDTRHQAAQRASLPLGPTVGIPPGVAATGRILEGVSSWYGPGFHGRRTSSGALFDERDFTVAHKTLPFGTLLLVTYRDRQAVVMVNDRGPFIEGRDFDLSKAAADYLGLGLGTIRAEIVAPSQ